MASSVDGRIIGENWGSAAKKKAFSSVYEQCHGTFESEAWMCGRVTLEKDFTDGLAPDLKPAPHPIERVAFIADKSADSFAVAIDGSGRLGWEENHISGDHIIEVLTEQVGDDYLFYLQRLGISYVFAGKKEIDFKKVMEQLATHFPIKTLLLEGGGHINGSMLQAGLIDELSLLIVPVADGTADTATTFDIAAGLGKSGGISLKLTSVQQMDHEVIWLRYKVQA